MSDCLRLARNGCFDPSMHFIRHECKRSVSNVNKVRFDRLKELDSYRRVQFRVTYWFTLNECSAASAMARNDCFGPSMHFI